MILHLIPVGLGASAPALWLPPAVQELAARLRFYIAENAKTARAFLKLIGTHYELPDIIIHTLNRATTPEATRGWLSSAPECRTEERRVGKECVRTGRSRWA